MIWYNLSYFRFRSHPVAMFQLKSPNSSGEQVKNWFSGWQLWRQNFIYFWSTSHSVAAIWFSTQIAQWFRNRRQKSIFKMVAVVAILDFQSTNFSYYYNYWSAFCSTISFDLIRRVVCEKVSKIDFQDVAAILDVRSAQFSYFRSSGVATM